MITPSTRVNEKYAIQKHISTTARRARMVLCCHSNADPIAIKSKIITYKGRRMRFSKRVVASKKNNDVINKPTYNQPTHKSTNSCEGAFQGFGRERKSQNTPTRARHMIIPVNANVSRPTTRRCGNSPQLFTAFIKNETFSLDMGCQSRMRLVRVSETNQFRTSHTRVGRRVMARKMTRSFMRLRHICCWLRIKTMQNAPTRE